MSIYLWSEDLSQSSFPRRRESIYPHQPALPWIPACAGMTGIATRQFSVTLAKARAYLPSGCIPASAEN
jgi:hypothetical protein